MAYLAQRLAADLAVSMVADVRRDDSLLYAFTNFSAANYLSTQVGGGEAGVASGFGVAALVIPTKLDPTLNNLITARSDVAIAQGYYMRMDGAGSLNFFLGVDGTTKAAPNVHIKSSDIGRVHLIVAYLNAASLGFWLSRFKGLQAAITNHATFLPYSGSQSLGVWLQASTHNARDLQILGVLTFRGLPSDAQLQAFFDRTRLLGDLPDSIDGAVVTHLWSAKRELASQVVVSGQTAPASTADRITGAAVDAMGRVGAPSVVVIDPSIEGRRTYGAQGFSGANYFATPNAMPGGPRFWLVLHFRTDVAYTFGFPKYAGRETSASYWSLLRGGSGIQFYVKPTTAFAGAGTPYQPLTIGNTNVFIGYCDDRLVRGWFDGLSTGAAVDIGADYVVPIGALHVGKSTLASNALLDSLWGLAYGESALTDADALAITKAVRAGGMIAIKDRAMTCYDLTADVIANGGPQNGVPAQVLDRAGTDHLTRVGTGLTVAQRVERVWSYETSPILHGANAFTDADYYERAGGIATSAAGYYHGYLLRFDTQALASQTRYISSQHDVAGSGFLARTIGTNSALSAQSADGAGNYVSSPSISIAAADLGKLFPVLFVHDAAAGKLRAMHKRVEQGTATSITGYTPSTTGPLRLGRHNQSAGYPAAGITVFGMIAGLGIPTLAEYQAWWDAVLADERIVDIPGRAGFRVDFLDQDGAAPAMLTDRVGAAHMTRVGNPALASTYARCWGA